MVTRAGVRFQLKRTTGLLKVLLSNKLAAIGLFLLVVFTFIAVAAPLLTPYSPYERVSGSLAQPEWVANFPDGYYLSKNIIVVKDPNFLSPSGLSEWQINSPNGSMTNLLVSFAQNVTAPSTPGGSIQIVNTGNKRLSVDLSKSFAFPYHGPPRKFEANFALMAVNASKADPVYTQLYITRGGDNQKFDLWYTDYRANDTIPNNWIPSASESLDSGQTIVTASVGAVNSPFDAAQIIFSSQQNYTYGVPVSLSDDQTMYLES